MIDPKLVRLAVPALALGLLVVAGGCTKSEETGGTVAPAAKAPGAVAPEASVPRAKGAGTLAEGAPDEELAVWADADPDLGEAPLAVQLSADPLEEIEQASYTWDFGDGSAPSGEQNPKHVYAKAGQYTARLTVKDAAGRIGTDEAQIDVE